MSHTFDPDGRETQTTDANTHVTKRVFDGAGRQVREVRGLLSSCVDPCPGREEVVSKYDAVGNLLEAKSLRVTGADYDVRNTWDDLNRNVRMEDALGNVTSKAYDAAGNLLCVKAPKGSGHKGHGWAGGRTLAQLEAVACPGTNVTRYTWDELGKQMSVQDANGSLWQFRYDETRNLVAKLDANAHLTTYRFDARNQRTEELQHLGNGQTLPSRNALPSFVAPNAGFTTGTLRTRWTYDANGQLEDEVDAKGQLKHHVYGLLKRLETVTYSGHVAPRALPSIDSIGYTYRGEGELDTCTEAKTTSAGAVTEVTRHFYDGLERRNRTQRYDGYETTYGYDVKGNRTLVRDADGVETAYTYDTVDRLSSATTPVGTTTYTYWEDGLLKTTRYGASMTESRSYDAASRLTVVEAVAPSRVPSLVSRFDYAYDANGNRESQVETRGLAGETTTYGYDEADRLIGVAYPAETHLYQVDAVGNRTGEKRAAAGVVAALTVAAFAALSPAVASAAVERQHNAVDWATAVVDVKASTTTALSYDANGNRTGEGTKQYAWDIRDTLTRASDGATVLGTYDYDAKLQRVKADTTQGHVEYVLDGKYVLREAGARSRRYHFGEGEALAVTGVGGTSAQDSWLLIDGLGSVVTEANATASSVTARQFDAWGNYRNNTAPTANETRLGYTGHQFDVETGLTYARARYYDSKLGIFLSRDAYEGALGYAPSLHRFAYAHNQPLRYRDPNGRAGVRTELKREAEKFHEQAKQLEDRAFQQTSTAKAAGLIVASAAAKTTGLVAEGLQTAWSGFNKLSGGAIDGLDRVHDAQEAGDSRYSGEYGTLNYLQDVNKETTTFAVKSVVQLGAGKLVDKVLPAGGSTVGDVAGRGLERAALRGGISLAPRVVEHISGGAELTVQESVRSVGTSVVTDAAGELISQAADELVSAAASPGEGTGEVTTVNRIGGRAPSNLALKPGEKKLVPPGISVLLGNSPQEAADQMRARFPLPKFDKLHKATEVVGPSTIERIRESGFDVMADPTANFPNHGRTIHPEGESGFCAANLCKLSEAFSEDVPTPPRPIGVGEKD